MIGAPDLVAKFGGKFIPIKKPAAAQPAAAGGLPAVQAQAPAAPKIPAEAEGLYKQLGAIEAQEEKISSSEKQNRIKQINKEIESLQKTTRVSSPSYAPAMGVPYSKIPQKKSAAEIKQAITKIEQLVSERNRLEGKTQTAKSQFNSQEDVIKAIKSRQLTREQGKTILQNQFGLQ
jgi:peptidoglycan hydrolase CwlO-like protein